jgi:DNA polymerase-1
LACGDYSQIEYRILAHVTEDPFLLDAFNTGKDMQAFMAASVRGGDWKDYNNKKDKARYKVRTAFKNVNFAVIYGAGPKKVAKMSGIEIDEAYELLGAHEDMVPGVYTWKKSVLRDAKTNGYAETMFGRRIQLIGIHSRDRAVRGHAERLAVNATIQGAAADLMRLAMPLVDRVFRCANGRLLMQVHDELLGELPERNMLDIELFADVMNTAADHLVKWRVPITSEWGIGKTWAEAKG